MIITITSVIIAISTTLTHVTLTVAITVANTVTVNTTGLTRCWHVPAYANIC